MSSNPRGYGGFHGPKGHRRHRIHHGGRVHSYTSNAQCGTSYQSSADRRQNADDYQRHKDAQHVPYEEGRIRSKQRHQEEDQGKMFRGASDAPLDSGSRKTKMRHPPGLKGAQIGLWYSAQSKKREEKTTEILLGPEAKILLQNLFTNFVTPSESKGTPLPECLAECHEPEQDTFEETIEKIKYSPMKSDVVMDKLLHKRLLKKQENFNYQEMFSEREKLPTYKMKEEIVDAIRNNQIVLISGGTGSGKTTQIVQYVLDDCIMKEEGSLCNIICTQPRRISAVTVSERVACERAESIGDSIGYQIRLESKLPSRKQGNVIYMTTGILLQHLNDNPILQGVSHLFIDEIHERNIESDFIMGLMKYILPKRPDLKLILMSATINSKIFSQYYGGIPVIDIPGFLHPVKEYYLEDVLSLTKFRFSPSNQGPRFKRCSREIESDFEKYILPYVRNLEMEGLYPRSVTEQLKNPELESDNVLLMAATIQYICMNEPSGAILVFVPGLTEIQKLHKELISNSYFCNSNYIIVPMHSLLSTMQQKKAFILPPQGVRKIIIATNLLETSITINDIRYVVDSGKNKVLSFDKKHNITSLGPSWITMASAKQRRGRAGRTQPGKCYKLYTKAREMIFDSYPLPEILTVRLENVILKVKMLKLGHAAPFLQKLLDAPDPAVVEMSLKVLRTLNALDDKERLTTLGRHLAVLPLDPHAGKMIIMAAIYGCVDPIFSIAACLGYKEPFIVPFGAENNVRQVKKLFAGDEKSDHLILSQAIKQWETANSYGEGFLFAHSNFLSNNILMLIRDMKCQLAKQLHQMNFLCSPDPKDPRSNVNSENVDVLKAVLSAGLYPNVAVIRNKQRKKKSMTFLKTLDHSRVVFHKKSYCNDIDCFESSYCVYHVMLKSSSIFLHDVTVINPVPLLLFGQKLSIVNESNSNITVDDLLKFKCGRETRNLLKTLRDKLDEVIYSVIKNPEPVNWEEPNSKILVESVNILNPKNWTFIEHQTAE